LLDPLRQKGDPQVPPTLGLVDREELLIGLVRQQPYGGLVWSSVRFCGTDILRWKSKPRTELQREKKYTSWNRKLPMTRQVHDRVRELATHHEPIYALLRTTSPPTLKKTDDGI